MEGMSDGLSNFNFVGHGGWVRIGRDHVDRGLWLSCNRQSLFNVCFGVKKI